MDLGGTVAPASAALVPDDAFAESGVIVAYVASFAFAASGTFAAYVACSILAAFVASVFVVPVAVATGVVGTWAAFAVNPAEAAVPVGWALTLVDLSPE